ncbi:MAG: iron ABC transporter permease [Bacteroidales bacterium]|jgi:iron complex transport system permease protein|nr:iron ABC transporter permease [Bacteroidales bacterium]
MKRTPAFFTVVISLLILMAVVLSVKIGVVSVSFGTVFRVIGAKIGVCSMGNIDSPDIITIWELRLPRIVMSLLAGAVLAICGAAYQSIFRNQICDPYIMGISSGASLGAAVAFIAGWDIFLFGITIPALITACLTLFLILGLSGLSRKSAIETLLLVGIVINFLISALITILLVAHQEDMQKILFWTMGSFSSISWSQIGFSLPLIIIGVGVLFYYAKNLTIMQLGTETALSLGVNARKTALLVLVFSSLLIAVIVSFCGVIGFIGLIVPHIARMLFGNHNRVVFLHSMLIGALFLLLADTVARTIAIPTELPVGAITALTGAPYFVFLLLRNRKFS